MFLCVLINVFMHFVCFFNVLSASVCLIYVLHLYSHLFYVIWCTMCWYKNSINMILTLSLNHWITFKIHVFLISDVWLISCLIINLSLFIIWRKSILNFLDWHNKPTHLRGYRYLKSYVIFCNLACKMYISLELDKTHIRWALPSIKGTNDDHIF